mmetsp:Transcript_525/g.1495  ORF Transcript_525/g.1495 Transcript_525/m.1495 type:complete len:224 (+) Transcript_525:1640-2311(+)
MGKCAAVRTLSSRMLPRVVKARHIIFDQLQSKLKTHGSVAGVILFQGMILAAMEKGMTRPLTRALIAPLVLQQNSAGVEVCASSRKQILPIVTFVGLTRTVLHVLPFPSPTLTRTQPLSTTTPRMVGLFTHWRLTMSRVLLSCAERINRRATAHATTMTRSVVTECCTISIQAISVVVRPMLPFRAQVTSAVEGHFTLERQTANAAGESIVKYLLEKSAVMAQ